MWIFRRATTGCLIANGSSEVALVESGRSERFGFQNDRTTFSGSAHALIGVGRVLRRDHDKIVMHFKESPDERKILESAGDAIADHVADLKRGGIQIEGKRALITVTYGHIAHALIPWVGAEL